MKCLKREDDGAVLFAKVDDRSLVRMRGEQDPIDVKKLTKKRLELNAAVVVTSIFTGKTGSVCLMVQLKEASALIVERPEEEREDFD